MAYFGKISPEYATRLEIAERNYTYELLAEQLKEEKKQADEESKKIKSQSNKIKSHVPRPRR
jgi:hypothetical protein